MKLADPFAGRCFFYVKECPFKEECSREYIAPCQSWGWTTEECRQRVLKHLKISDKHLKNCPPGDDRHDEYQMATQLMDVFCDGNDDPGSASGIDPRNTDGETGMDVHATGQAATAKAAQKAVARGKTTRMLAHEEMSKRLPKDVEEGVIDEETLAQGRGGRRHLCSRMRVRRPGWSRSRSRSLRSRSYRSPSHCKYKGESKGRGKWEGARNASTQSFFFDKRRARINVENARAKALGLEAAEVVSKVESLVADIGAICKHLYADDLPITLLTHIQYVFLRLNDFKDEANARIDGDDDSPLPFSLKDVEETCVTGTRDHLPSKSSWAGVGRRALPSPFQKRNPFPPLPQALSAPTWSVIPLELIPEGWGGGKGVGGVRWSKSIPEVVTRSRASRTGSSTTAQRY